MARYRQLNADIAPIESLYYESGSKRLEPGDKFSASYGKFSVFKWSCFILFDYIHLKLSAHIYFVVLSHSMRSKYKNCRRKLYDVITVELYSTYVL